MFSAVCFSFFRSSLGASKSTPRDSASSLISFKSARWWSPWRSSSSSCSRYIPSSSFSRSAVSERFSSRYCRTSSPAYSSTVSRTSSRSKEVMSFPSFILNTCGISSPPIRPSGLILKVIVGRQVARSRQWAVRAPIRVLRHDGTDLIHRMVAGRHLDDHLIMYMGDDRKSGLFQPPHGFRQDIPCGSLGRILAEFASIGLLPGPAAGTCRIPCAFKCQAHAPEAVWLEFRLQIGELPAARKRHPKRPTVVLEADPTGGMFLMGLDRVHRSLLHIPPELYDVGRSGTPLLDDVRKFFLLQSHGYRAHGNECPGTSLI